MAKQNKKDASTDSSTDILVQGAQNTNTGAQNETQEVQTDNAEGNGEETDGGQTEGGTDSELDIESQTDETGETGNDVGSEIVDETETGTSPRDQDVDVETVDDVNEDSEFDQLDPAMQKKVAEAALEAINKALKNAELPAEPKAKTEQRDKIAADVFEKHTKAKTLYFTSDMTPFFAENDAIKHANKLGDGLVIPKNKE